jgi:two-component system cell cycle sensor histidine kinase/response regulator CckA
MGTVAEKQKPDQILSEDNRSSPIWLVLILALVIATTGTLLAFLKTEEAQPFILGLLALLAVFGIFALFAAAVGLIELTGGARKLDVSRSLLDSFPEGALVTDGAGRILYANDAYLALTEADGPGDVRTLERVYARDPEVAEVLYRLTNAGRDNKAASEDIRIRNDNHTQRWLRIRVMPVKGEGTSRNYLWTVADITRERASQENIVQDLQHAIDYLDHAPAGFMSVDARGNITYMNATLAQLLDYDLADTASGELSIKDLVQPAHAALFAGLAAKPGEQLTEVYDIDLLKRNGNTCPVRLLHRVSFAADGTQGASRTLVLDRAEGSAGDMAETLRAAEVRFARFFSNAPMAIATVDKDGRIGRSNAHFARLIPSHAARGSSLLDAIIDMDRPQVQAAFEAATKGKGNIAPIDVTIAGDKQRFARLFVSAVDEDERDSEAALVFATDTTQQRALEIQFAQSQKMQAIGQLAGGIAHDFNNVLTAIIGFSDLLLANHRPTDPSFQDIMNIKQNANRAAGLVRQLLAFSRRQTLRPEVLALPDTLSELSVLLSRLLGEKVKLDVRNGKDLWFVKADINQFEQVIMNLSVNARDAMPDGGRLTISTQNVKAGAVKDYNYTIMPPTDYVLIEVTDTGTGIPEHVLDKIFEPFFSTKEVGKGTGLGLSTVYGIVKQTDGFIFVETEVGKGSTFRIFLPRYQPRTDEIPVKIMAKDVKSADLTGHGTILLVEDEEAVRSFAARALRSRGYTVLEADTGLSALEQMKAHKDEIALVVSDVVMPEMDGPTMLREMRKMKDDLKIIFMSGYAEEAFSKNLDENEKFGFLPKPFSLKQLAAKVKDTLVPEAES